MTLSIMTLGIMTLSIKTLRIMTLTIMTLSITDILHKRHAASMAFGINGIRNYDAQHYDTQHKRHSS
jgi:hypothetical protein